MNTWQLVSTELSAIDAKGDSDIGKGVRVLLDHKLSITEDDSLEQARLIVGATTTLVGEAEKGKEAFRVFCKFKATYALNEESEETEESAVADKDSEFIGQQLYLVARPLIVTVLNQMKINSSFLPYSLPAGIPVEKEDPV